MAEQGLRGFARLRFTRFVEEEFRQHYAKQNFGRVTPLLVLALVAVSVITGYALAKDQISTVMATFSLAVTTPLLVATLVASRQQDRNYFYQPLLAVSALCIGLIVTSVTLRASLHGTPYYFAAHVAWVMMVWLNLGLLFNYAAATAVTLSVAYAWGLFHWQFGQLEATFEVLMLIGINLIGALSCFQLESTTRTSFISKRMLEDKAERDGLTGLYNRRAYNDYMEKIWRQSQRDERAVMILLMDIDHFKAFNDLYGHQAGDDALKRVAEVIAMGAQRPLDLAARFGGEEFALVLYCPDEDFGRDLPEHLRRRVESLAIPHAGSSASRFLTVSIGVSIVAPGAERSLAGAVQMADEALYQAKEEGRNRVVVKETRSTHIETGRFRAGRRRAAAG